jgi:hypothetical protein
VVAVPFVRFASNERAETTLAFLAECFEVLDAGLRRLKLGALRRLADNSVGRVIGLFGVGPVIAAAVLRDVRTVSRFPGRGTSPGPRSGAGAGRRRDLRLGQMPCSPSGRAALSGATWGQMTMYERVHDVVMACE